MYKVIIELKKDISEDVLKKLTEIINAAFDNRGGRVSDSCADSLYRFEFVGGEEFFGCMQLGLLILKDNKLFWNSTDVWQWIDEDDESECCDVKVEFAEFVR